MQDLKVAENTADEGSVKRPMLYLLRYSWGALLITAFFTLLSQLILKNLYRFLAFDEQFYMIFSQLSGEKMSSPLIALILISGATLILFCKLWERGGGARFAAVAFGIVMFLILFFVSLFFTSVNGVLFGDVLRSLIPLISEGVL